MLYGRYLTIKLSLHSLREKTKTVPNYLLILLLVPLCNPLSLSMSKTCDMHVINRIRKSEWDVISLIAL